MTTELNPGVLLFCHKASVTSKFRILFHLKQPIHFGILNKNPKPSAKSLSGRNGVWERGDCVCRTEPLPPRSHSISAHLLIIYLRGLPSVLFKLHLLMSKVWECQWCIYLIKHQSCQMLITHEVHKSGTGDQITQTR